MIETGNARIVNVSSQAHRSGTCTLPSTLALV
jgi:hypothetical protein